MSAFINGIPVPTGKALRNLGGILCEFRHQPVDAF